MNGRVLLYGAAAGLFHGFGLALVRLDGLTFEAFVWIAAGAGALVAAVRELRP